MMLSNCANLDCRRELPLLARWQDLSVRLSPKPGRKLILTCVHWSEGKIVRKDG